MRAAGYRAGVQLLLLGVVLAGASGCRHKTKVAAVPLPPPKQLPVDTTAKVPPPQPVVETVPLQPTPLPAVIVPTKKKKVRRTRKPVTPTVLAASSAGGGASPGQVASSGPAPEVNAIGALTSGGSESPQLRRQATELISALEKRLAGLGADKREQQKDQIVRVMNFRRQAQAALDSGDAEGAVTLATKAKLLLDDLMK